MKLTPAVKRRIGGDWQKCVPGMTAWKPMHLLRRHGPLLLGVALEPDRANTDYTPVAHTHVLGTSFPVVSFGFPVKGQFTSASAHERNLEQAATGLLSRYPLLRSPSIGVLQVLTFFRDFLSERRDVPTNVFPFHAFSAVVITSAFAGFEAEARHFRQAACDAATEAGLEPSDWWNKSATLVSQKDVVRLVGIDAEALKVLKVPDVGLEFDSCLAPSEWQSAFASLGPS